MKKALLFLFLVLLFAPVLGFWYQSPDVFYIKQDADLNGEDINAVGIWANFIDVNAIFADYYVARNYIDSNFLMDANFLASVGVGEGVFADSVFASNNMVANGTVSGDGFLSPYGNCFSGDCFSSYSGSGVLDTVGDDWVLAGSGLRVDENFSVGTTSVFEDDVDVGGSGSGRVYVSDGTRYVEIANGTHAGYFYSGDGYTFNAGYT